LKNKIKEPTTQPTGKIQLQPGEKTFVTREILTRFKNNQNLFYEDSSFCHRFIPMLFEQLSTKFFESQDLHKKQQFNRLLH
jgi:hypothetical protein